MTPLTSLCRRGFLASLFFVFLGSGDTLWAAGTIRGRVFNPATGEYVKNAEISVLAGGITLTAITEEGGSFAVAGGPEGSARVSAAYAGYRADAATVVIASGQIATQDFSLKSTDAGTDRAD